VGLLIQATDSAGAATIRVPTRWSSQRFVNSHDRAMIVEYRRGELRHVLPDSGYFALAAFVLFGRLFTG
jgi:hypothetical protein